MSKRVQADMTCPSCAARFPITLFRSIWVEDASNRQLIIDDKINRFDCPKCDLHIDPQYPFLATNVKRGFALWFEPHHDPKIDNDFAEYLQSTGPNSFYSKAPRIPEWEAFKAKLIEFENSASETPVEMSDEMRKHMAGFIKSIRDKRKPWWQRILAKILGR